MADTIGSLVIDLVANTASFATQLQGARKSVEDFAAGVKTVFGGLAAVFSIAGIAELTKDTLAFGDQLQKAAIQTGIGSNAISELAFAAKQANIDLPQLVSTIDKMEKSISTAASGTGTAKSTFDALGISLAQLKTLSPDQQFEEIANQISKLQDPTDKARAAMELFGRAGAELLPLFEQGAAGIEEARQKAVDFGASLDSDQLAKLATANTAVKDLGASFSALATTLTAKVAPGISGFFDSITAVVTGNKPVLLATQIRQLQDQLAYAQGDGTGGPAVAQIQGEITKAQIALQGLKLAKQISDGLAKPGDLIDNPAPGFQSEIQPVDITAQKIQIDAMTKFYQDLDDATKTGAEKTLADTMDFEAKLALLVQDGKITETERANRLSAGVDASAMTDLMTTNAAAIQAAYKQSIDGVTAGFKGISDSAMLAGKNSADAWNEMAQNAKSAATSIQDAFATFLVDPFDGGLKKMLTSWVQTLAQMAAKAASADIFKSIFGDTSDGRGLSALLQGFLGGGFTPTFDASPGAASAILDGLPAAANGNSWTVGGSGGTDSQLVKFKATPGERVLVSTPGQQAQQGGVTVVNNNYIDSRTDQTQIAQMIQQSTQLAISQSVGKVVDMSRRGQFSAR